MAIEDDINYDGGKLFKWEEGVPTPRSPKRRQAMNKTQMEATIFAAGSLPYTGEWCPDTNSWRINPEFDGLTLAEVAAIQLAREAASGSLPAIKEFYDRTLGKPKQQVESVTTTRTYAEYLDMLAQEAGETIQIEAKVSNIFDDDDLLEGL